MKTSISIVVIIFSLIIIYHYRSELITSYHLYKTKSLSFGSKEFSRKLLYRLYVPEVKLNSDSKYPIVLILHGGNERGSDNKRQIEFIANTFLSRKVQKQHPSFVVIPQCPQGTQWVNTGFVKTPFGHYNQSQIVESEEMQLVIKTMNQIVSEYPVDISKIYVIGFSMGSTGTWDIITRYPDIFAAAVPISGLSDLSTSHKMKDIPIWAFHGMLDSIAPARLNIEMQKAVQESGGNCKLTLFEKTGHYCVPQAFKNPDLIKWMFSQKKIKLP